jgi:hypothetical protein
MDPYAPLVPIANFVIGVGKKLIRAVCFSVVNRGSAQKNSKNSIKIHLKQNELCRRWKSKIT